MMFSCGITKEERKRLFAVDRAQRAKWHKHFALWPVTVAGESGKKTCVWLEWVERRSDWYVGFEESWYINEYRLPV